MRASIIGVVVLVVLSIFSGAAMAEPIGTYPNNSGTESSAAITGSDYHQITGPSSLPVGSIGKYNYSSERVNYVGSDIRGHRFYLLWDLNYLSLSSYSYKSSPAPSGVYVGQSSIELDIYPNQYIPYAWIVGNLRGAKSGSTTVTGKHTVDIAVWPDENHYSYKPTTIY